MSCTRRYNNRERRAEIRAGKEADRIEIERQDAAEYEDIAAGDFVIYWEAVVRDEDMEEAQRNAFKGLTVKELQCPVVLCKALEACHAKECGASLRVIRYRQPQGNLNGKFIEGVLVRNSKWEMRLDRDSVVMVRPEFNGHSMKLSAKTRRHLSEIVPVKGMYMYISTKGLVRT